MSGCAGVPLGRIVDDPVRQQRLVETYPPPKVTKVVYHTVLYWPGRELSLIEIVKTDTAGSRSIVGLSDLGTTVYAVRLHKDGDTEILTKNLPLSDTWLLQGPVAELSIPWEGPRTDDQLRRHSDGTWRLFRKASDKDRLLVFDENTQWTQTVLLSGARIHSETTFDWDGQALPKRMRTTNRHAHYHAVRERASLE